jgi:hypothetical protein
MLRNPVNACVKELRITVTKSVPPERSSEFSDEEEEEEEERKRRHMAN